MISGALGASLMLWFALVGYGAAALLYGGATLVLLVRRPKSRGGPLLTAAVFTTSVWAAASVVSLAGVSLSPLALISLDAVHLLAWTACVLSWLEPSATRKGLLRGSVAAGLLAIAAKWQHTELSSLGPIFYSALVLMALAGVLAVEQVYRNAHQDAQRKLVLLCVAAGAILGIDLFVYAHAALLGAPNEVLWSLRGLINACALPLIVIGARRRLGSDRALVVSRHVMFYTASLLGVGGYLLAMGLVAYLLRAFGREWSFPLDVAFLTAGVGVLVVGLFSTNIRARFKVFLVKHFYSTKYDYREAWLRLTQSLSRTGDLRESAAAGLEGMARIVGSQRGDLMIERDGHRYESLVSLGSGRLGMNNFERDHPLVAFLSSSGWVIDSEEYTREPDRYGTAFGHPDDHVLPRNSLIVPLDRQGYLQGFIVLEKPAGLRTLNFEDHDILKTAGRQVAAVLAQALAQEKLAETRQFEALNRLSAFLMHDLKNIVAQQDLVVANAQRFRHRADFIDDAFMTIRAGTERIKKVLAQLANASRTIPAAGRVDISKVLMEVRSQCDDRRPVPEIDLQVQPAWAHMNRDELVSVVFHLVRNAQDATSPDGRISIGLRSADGMQVITVADTGCGMDEAFVRDRLFRPFDSTKGAEGMGIGAYQARHFVRLRGGELDVESKRGVGTTFTVRLPAVP